MTTVKTFQKKIPTTGNTDAVNHYYNRKTAKNPRTV